MKKLLATLVLSVLVVIGSNSATTEAAEIQTQIACDGCVIMTEESWNSANENGETHSMEWVKTLQHIRHVKFTCHCGNDCYHHPFYNQK